MNKVKKINSPEKNAEMKDANSSEMDDLKLFSKFTELEDLIGPSYCSLCDRNIAQCVKIRSIDHPKFGVSQKPLIVCLECHRTGVSVPKSDKNSEEVQMPLGRYIVMDNLDFPLFTKDWDAREELLLLQGIMKCGLGNWFDISEQYVKSQSAKNCEDHYFTFYYKNKLENIPTNEKDCIIKGKRQLKASKNSDTQIITLIDEEKADLNLKRLQSHKNQVLKDLEEDAQQLKQMNSDHLQKTAQFEQLSSIDVGFIPHPDATQTASSLNPQSNATAQNPKRSQVCIAQTTSEIVGFQQKRGDFDQEYDMDAELLLADMEFFDDDNDETLNLKNSIIELYNARLDERIRRKKFVIERGLLDIKRSQKYERKRSKEERDIINQMKVFARFNTEEEHQKIVSNLIKERTLRDVIEQLKFFRSKGITSIEQIEKYIETQRKGMSGQQSKRAERGSGFKDFGPIQQLIEDPEKILGLKNAQTIEYGPAISSNDLNKSSQKISQIQASEEFQLLDSKEKEFCIDRNILPSDFYSVKCQLLKEMAKNTAISHKILKEKGIDVSELKQNADVIFDFIVKDNT